MTREEIKYKAGSIVDGMVSNNVPPEICDSYYQGFIEGAKWADAKPNLSEEEQVGMGGLGMVWQKQALIKKACEWLIGEFSQMQDRDGHPNVESRSCISVEELIQDFRKAMEG